MIFAILLFVGPLKFITKNLFRVQSEQNILILFAFLAINTFYGNIFRSFFVIFVQGVKFFQNFKEKTILLL